MVKNIFFAVTVLVSTFSFAQEKDVTVFHEVQEDQSIKIFSKNNTELLQSVNVEGKIKGMQSTHEFPVLILLQPNETKHLTTLTPEPGKSYSYNYKYAFIIGDVTATHNDNYIYQLPYQKGEKHLVGQGYREQPTHMNQYAIDFNMDEGTEICAIREGIVFQVMEEHNKGCPDKSCNQYNNFVMIRHDDGSIADYSHIQKKGALVSVGDSVKAGQVIAKSGSTGWASGAHLHLEVYVMRFTGQQSVKVEYYLNKESIGIPQSGRTYKQEIE